MVTMNLKMALRKTFVEKEGKFIEHSDRKKKDTSSSFLIQKKNDIIIHLLI